MQISSNLFLSNQKIAIARNSHKIKYKRYQEFILHKKKLLMQLIHATITSIIENG